MTLSVRSIRSALRSFAYRYGYVFVAIGLVFGLRMLLVPLTGTGAPYVLSFGAVILLTVLKGRNQGLMLLLITGPLGGYFFVYRAGYPFTQVFYQALLYTVEGVLMTCLTAKFKSSKRQAERAVEMRDDLIAVVSHDLKNPLSAIDLKIAAMLRGGITDEARAREQLKSIKGAVGRMGQLIDGLLDLAKIESGQLKIDAQSIPVDTLIQELREGMAAIAEAKSIQLTFAQSVHCNLLCDPGRLLQVLTNLVGNAIKFTAEGGKVEVRSATSDFSVDFTVRDNGPGIPLAQLPFVFDRYWQARQTARMGTGLGLSIAKGLVEAHGGTIWVRSKVGEGSSFCFTVPKAPAPAIPIKKNENVEITSLRPGVEN